MGLSNLPSAVYLTPDRVSPCGVFRVTAYAPREGEAGIPITVETRFHNLYPDRRVYLRIVVGVQAVRTNIKLIDEQGDSYRLDGLIPPFHEQLTAAPIVPVSVQAVDEDDHILDSLTFGEFTYWNARASICRGLTTVSC